MKVMIRIFALIGLVGLAVNLYADDQPGAQPGKRDPGVNAHQHHERARIKQGVRSGELTKDEASKLAKEQRGIRKEERAYKSDGKLTKDERKDLHKDMNHASRDIAKEKHDAEKR